MPTKNEVRAILLSLDRDIITDFLIKYNVLSSEDLSDDQVFWMTVHKAIVAIPEIPLKERLKSRKWLLENNSKPLKDQDCPIA